MSSRGAALDAAQSIDPDSTDEYVALYLALRTALTIVERLLAGEDPPDRFGVPSAPNLPMPGTTDHDPFRPEPEPESDDDHGPFAMVDAAEEEAREVRAVSACRTLGEFRTLALEYVEPPVRLDEDDYPFLLDNHPVNLSAF